MLYQLSYTGTVYARAIVPEAAAKRIRASEKRDEGHEAAAINRAVCRAPESRRRLRSAPYQEAAR
jgi:hypothetical protein